MLKQQIVLIVAAAIVTMVACTQDSNLSNGKQSHEPITEIAVGKKAQGQKRATQPASEDSAQSGVFSMFTTTTDAKSSNRVAQMHESLSSMPYRDFNHTIQPVTATNRENYLPIDESPVKQTMVNPVSTFSIDVDTASYSNIRRMLATQGRLPPHDAVRLEEMINYFSYAYQQPENTDQPFSVNTELAPSPWNSQRKLLQIGLKGYAPEATDRPPANLVFLVDVSGSMQDANKLPLVKKSLKLLLNNLNEDDRIALTVYAGAAGLVLESTPANQRSKIMSAIDNLQAGGSTHGSAGIKLAYQVAQEHLIHDGINRVLIASDGDMNVGTVSIDALKELVEEKRKSGIALTTLGFGSGNYNYSLMEQLADVGNGNASYIDNLKEAYKVLVTEAQSTLMTIAGDVKIQVEFNPAVVAEYRLLGYENRRLQTEDFTNDKVDAGEIGAGHTVTALYEVTLVNSNANRLPPLRYQSPENGEQTPPALDNELAYVKLRYKLPGQSKSTETVTAIQTDSLVASFRAASEDFQFASAVAGFAQLLTGGKYLEQYSYKDTLDILRQNRGNDDHGYRSELISLVELADGISSTYASGD